MIEHVSIGVRDLAKAKKFYDATFGPLGYKCLTEGATWLGYGSKAPEFWILKVERPVASDSGSGLHFCVGAEGRTAVDAFYNAALTAGGSDNGKPGVRVDYGENYYAAFVNDPEGYRIEAYFSGNA